MPLAQVLTSSPESEEEPGSQGEIVFDQVSKTFSANPFPAVSSVSFRVTAGDLVVLLGPSGCGKTTLLKMVNRLYEPDSGTIRLNGQDIHSLPINKLRRKIGYVIQQVGLFPHMTIHRNIAVVPRLLGWSEDRINERVETLLELIGLPRSYLDRKPRQLSGGEQQRVGLARALAADPDILLMDEPFAAVDAINRERLQDELLRLQCRLNKTILFVTHDVDEAFRLADRILVMNAGKLVQYDSPIKLINRPANEYVRKLLNTDDALRHLSLMNVRSILKARSEDHPSNTESQSTEAPQPVLSPADNLRTALSLLLQSGQGSLPVREDSGVILGEISLKDVRSMLHSQNPGDKEKCDDIPDQ
jgi:osmoprotectant transport system ATP-binding protein